MFLLLMLSFFITYLFILISRNTKKDFFLLPKDINFLILDNICLDSIQTFFILNQVSKNTYSIIKDKAYDYINTYFNKFKHKEKILLFLKNVIDGNLTSNKIYNLYPWYEGCDVFLKVVDPIQIYRNYKNLSVTEISIGNKIILFSINKKINKKSFDTLIGNKKVKVKTHQYIKYTKQYINDGTIPVIIITNSLCYYNDKIEHIHVETIDLTQKPYVNSFLKNEIYFKTYFKNFIQNRNIRIGIL